MAKIQLKDGDHKPKNLKQEQNKIKNPDAKVHNKKSQNQRKQDHLPMPLLTIAPSPSL